MIITKYEDRESWMFARQGKITGSRLKDIISKRGAEKMGKYELIAERLAIAPDGENRLDRGTRLEDEALDRYEKETGKKVNRDLVIWQRDDNDGIAVSPDGTIMDTPIPMSEACEVKCLSSARHIRSYLENEVPDEYKFQVIQYFVTNDALSKLDVVFYDPRMRVKDFFVITVSRLDIQLEVDEYLEFQRKTLEEVNKIVLELIGF